MCIPLSPEVVETLKSLDRVRDCQADIPRAIADELLTHGLAYELRTGGSINMTAAGRLWLNRCADLRACVDQARPDFVLYNDPWIHEAMMKTQSTRWFALDQYAPVRDGWYEVRLVSGDTAFAKFGDGEWTEKPMLTFTRWRGLRSDPAKSGDAVDATADATAAKGVRDAWDAFFPGVGNEQHKPLAAAHGDHPRRIEAS